MELEEVACDPDFFRISGNWVDVYE